MKETMVKFCAVVFLLAASILSPWWLWHGAQVKAQERREALRQQAEHTAQLNAENERLHRQAALARNRQTLPDAQQRELMKLRSDIGRLRAAVKETEKLRESNQKLRLAAAKTEPTSSPGPSTADYWVKDQLAFSGYTSPESALKTALWAVRSGDVTNMLACMTPEVREKMEKERQKDEKSEAQSTAEFKSMADSLIAPNTAFRLLDQKIKSPDEAILNLSFEGEGRSRKFIMRKLGAEWKIQEMLSAGEDEPQ
jgi:hypothetical protein